MKKTKAFWLLLFFFVFSCLFRALAAVAKDVEYCEGSLTLSSEYGEDDVVEIALKLYSKQGIAAMLADLLYDGGAFLFLGCGSETMTLTYTDIGGRVSFLVDRCENSPAECVLVTFYFKRTGARGGEFTLNLKEQTGCLYYNEGNAPMELFPSLPESLTVNGDEEETEKDMTPRLISALLEYRDEKNAVLSFDVNVGRDCFAAGVKIFAVDIESGESKEYFVFRSIGADGVLCASAEIELYKKAAVIITAAGCERGGTVLGEKQMIVTPQ